jgi:hypothetical protein
MYSAYNIAQQALEHQALLGLECTNPDHFRQRNSQKE